MMVVEIDKSNILMWAQTEKPVAQACKVAESPFTIVDATIFTEAGYVGEDVRTCWYDCFRLPITMAKAEKGIIYVDEFDKISVNRILPLPRCKRRRCPAGNAKILEGTVAYSSQGGRKHPEQESDSDQHRDILFICGGAFEGSKDYRVTYRESRMGSMLR